MVLELHDTGHSGLVINLIKMRSTSAAHLSSLVCFQEQYHEMNVNDYSVASLRMICTLNKHYDFHTM